MGFFPDVLLPVNAAQINGVTITGTPAIGQGLDAASATTAAWAPQMQLQASTGLAGFALQNATPTIITWTTPNDGNMHHAQAFGEINVTVATTGGAIALNYTPPAGGAQAPSLNGGTLGTGVTSLNSGNSSAKTVGPNTVVSIAQSSAMTAGTASCYAAIWGY